MTTTAFALADPELSARLADRLATVEARLRDAVATTDLLVGATSTHLVSAGGKRLRPALVLAHNQIVPVLGVFYGTSLIADEVEEGGRRAQAFLVNRTG